MKVRGIVIIDYEIEGGFREAGIEEEALENLIKGYCENDKRILHHQVELRDRRGPAGSVDISKMKFRAN